METKEFLRIVITSKEGYFCLLIRPSQEAKSWEEWFKWPEEIDNIISRADSIKETHNVYFSSYLFATQKSTKENVLPTRTIQADLDNASMADIQPVPTVLIESSPGRHQGYWILKNEVDLEQHEILSRKITYSIPLCDHSGWPLGRKVRLPNTFNHKYLEGPRQVKVENYSGITYDASTIELLSDVNVESTKIDEEWLSTLQSLTLDVGPNELLETIKSKIPAKIYLSFNLEAKDRSRALWSLMCAAFRAELNRNQVYWLAKHSANNKFSSLRYNGDRELGKDVLRAEQVTKTKLLDVRTAINETRKLQATTTERRQLIFELVVENMKLLGTFLRTSDDNIWYIRKDLGRPILISLRSEYLNMILDLQFGLNSSEVEQTYVVAGLISYVRSLPVRAVVGSLSYYDPETNSILIHTGKSTVIRITKSNIEKVTDGSFGVIFPWITSNQEFHPNLNTSKDWSEILFDNCFNNVYGIEKEEALAVIKTWFIFLLFRNAAISRPILALFGMPGSGKSTLGRRIYRVIYGSNRGLGTITNQDDYDHTMSVDPLCILDNVDTFATWLPDRLAQAASTSDIVKRKLYTDVDTITLKRQALIGITAHNPKFGREDVADRLLLFNFQRLEHFEPENEILEKISLERNNIWGSIIKDIQKILNVNIENDVDYPQFRIEDFSKIGWRIAKALDIQKPFAEGLKKIYVGQRMFTLEEEYLLVNTIQRWVTRKKEHNFQSAGAIWTELQACTGDQQTFIKSYKGAVYLGKKLWAMQDSLKQMFDVQWKFNPVLGARTWRICDKNGREQEQPIDGEH